MKLCCMVRIHIFFICRKDTASEDRKLIVERIFPHFFLLNKLGTAWGKMYQKNKRNTKGQDKKSKFLFYLHLLFSCLHVCIQRTYCEL